MTINENVFFRQATLRICGHLLIEKAMHECLKYLSTIMPADLISMEVYEPDIDSLRIIAEATLSGYKRLDALVRMDEKAKKQLEAMYRKFQASSWPDADIIHKPEKDHAYKLMMKRLDIIDSSAMHMALETEGRPLCSMIIVAKGKDRYTREDARLFSSLKEPFAVAMSNTLKHREVTQLKELLADDNRFLHRQLLSLSGDQIIGADFGLKQVMAMARQVAVHDSPVLLSGETGVGKDVIANTIHYSSTRRDEPFIAVNCGAIPENLLDSELFGHEKGAFTGATGQKRGRFERANNGTIFLDEIGELPPQAQVRLLRVLQNKEIERVGGTRRIPLNIRVLAATNKNLENMVESSQFREDLWFRLNVFPISIPPLRERKEDIPALVRHFIEKKSRELKLSAIPPLAPGAIDRLSVYDWPGNVREMENVVERALIINHTDPITFDNLGAGSKAGAGSKIMPAGKHMGNHAEQMELMPTYDDMTKNYIQQILKTAKGKIHGPNGAAELAGMNPSTLRSKIKKLGISFERGAV